jgi:GntR family transcriptional regulator/MocR family aminotransferase
MAPGTRLPATRRLAVDLGVSRITVEEAYAELVADGLVVSRAGSGTFALPPFAVPSTPDRGREDGWPLWQENLRSRRELPTRTRPEPPDAGRLIHLGTGFSDSNLFPLGEFRRAVSAVMRRDGPAAFEYSEPCGYAPLRRTITHVLASQGLQTNPDRVLITAGSQQALALVAQLLLSPGDTVVVETPTYSVALDLFRALRLECVGVPVDEEGMLVERLERLLQQRHPKLIYTMPNFQNPTGACLNAWRRRELLSLADRYNVPILEDDFVGDLRYEGRAQPALKTLDRGGRVIYVSGFSKMLMPGLRVGFLVADGPVYDCLVAIKRVNDLACPNLVQRALDAYVSVGRYQTHLRRCCQAFKKRRDVMLQAIGRHLPPECEVARPRGGLFVWLRLPEGLSSEALLPTARREGVTFAPGPAFFVNSEGDGFLRLNFAAFAPEVIEEGIARLARALSATLHKQPKTTR